MIRLAVAVVVDPLGRLLAVRKRGTRMFIQPGGKIEDDETAVQTLRRELREEIGWTVDVQDLSALGTMCAVAANEPGRIVMAQLFSLRPLAEPKLACEIAEIAWLAPMEARLATTSGLTRQLIETYLATR